MESETIITELQPQIWGQGARRAQTGDPVAEEGSGQGYIHYARPQSTPEEQRQALGWLLALVHGVSRAEARRLLSALFRTYYQANDRSPVQALQQTAIRLDGSSFARPASMLLAVLHRDRLYLAQQGDGRAYLWREGTLHLLTEAQTGPQPDFYRPIILQAGDRLLLCNAELHLLFPEQGTAAQLAAGPGPELLQAARRQGQRADISLLLAVLSPATAPAADGLTGWQRATWAALIVAAVLQILALLALRLL